MSRLGQLLKRALQQEGSPIGFPVGRRASSWPLVLLASVAQAKELEGALGLGAQAVVLVPEVAHTLREDLKGLQVPWGLVDPAPAKEDVEALKALGLDFIVFQPKEAEASVIFIEGVGLMAWPDTEVTDIELRLLAELPLEAVWSAPPPVPLTVAKQLSLRRLSTLCRLPLVIQLPPQADLLYLRCLMEAGVAGVVAPSLEELARLRDVIPSLPVHRRRGEHLKPLLPISSRAPAPQQEPEEESSLDVNVMVF